MNEDFLLDKAVQLLKEGGVIIFPTDTVWGIGTSIDRLDGIRRLYERKGRDPSRPTAVLVADEMMANTLGVIDEEAKNLIRKFWPGGLTLVVKVKPGIPGEIQGEGGTVGIRQPNHPLVLKLIGKLGNAIVASSANFSGQNAPVSKESIDGRLLEMVDLVLEGEAGSDQPSTVLDVTGKPFKVLRQGKVTTEVLGLAKNP